MRKLIVLILGICLLYSCGGEPQRHPVRYGNDYIIHHEYANTARHVLFIETKIILPENRLIEIAKELRFAREGKKLFVRFVLAKYTSITNSTSKNYKPEEYYAGADFIPEFSFKMSGFGL